MFLRIERSPVRQQHDGPSSSSASDCRDHSLQPTTTTDVTEDHEDSDTILRDELGVPRNDVYNLSEVSDTRSTTTTANTESVTLAANNVVLSVVSDISLSSAVTLQQSRCSPTKSTCNSKPVSGAQQELFLAHSGENVVSASEDQLLPTVVTGCNVVVPPPTSKVLDLSPSSELMVTVKSTAKTELGEDIQMACGTEPVQAACDTQSITIAEAACDTELVVSGTELVANDTELIQTAQTARSVEPVSTTQMVLDTEPRARGTVPVQTTHVGRSRTASSTSKVAAAMQPLAKKGLSHLLTSSSALFQRKRQLRNTDNVKGLAVGSGSAVSLSASSDSSSVSLTDTASAIEPHSIDSNIVPVVCDDVTFLMVKDELCQKPATDWAIIDRADDDLSSFSNSTSKASLSLSTEVLAVNDKTTSDAVSVGSHQVQSVYMLYLCRNLIVTPLHLNIGLCWLKYQPTRCFSIWCMVSF